MYSQGNEPPTFTYYYEKMFIIAPYRWQVYRNILLTELCVVMMIPLPGSPQTKQGDQLRFPTHHGPEDREDGEGRERQRSEQ